MKYRQVRRFALIISFLASIFLIYLTTLSSSYPCQDNTGKRGCNNRLYDGKQILSDHVGSREEVKMLVQQAQIVKRSNSAYGETRQNSASAETTSEQNRVPDLNGKKKALPATKKTVTLSKKIRNHPVHSMYIQIKEADSPKIGDFPCIPTVVPNCCAFSVTDTNEAKRICEAFRALCKGFVMSTISSNGESFEYIMYLKNNLNGTMANFLTDYYIKVDYLEELKWNERKR